MSERQYLSDVERDIWKAQVEAMKKTMENSESHSARCIAISKNAMDQLATMARALEYREKRGTDLCNLVQKMQGILNDLDQIIRQHGISMDKNYEAARASIGVDIYRLLGKP